MCKDGHVNVALRRHIIPMCWEATILTTVTTVGVDIGWKGERVKGWDGDDDARWLTLHIRGGLEVGL